MPSAGQRSARTNTPAANNAIGARNSKTWASNRLLYQYAMQVETRFILHDTEAKEVPDFYTYYNSKVAGGTQVVMVGIDAEGVDLRVADRLHRLAESGKIELVIPYQLAGLEGDGRQLSGVVVADLEGQEKTLPADGPERDKQWRKAAELYEGALREAPHRPVHVDREGLCR